MGLPRVTTADFAHLNDGLPPEIARLKAAGHYDEAIRLIDAALANESIPELAPLMRAERVRMERIPEVYRYTRAEAIALIRREWPKCPGSLYDDLVRRGRIDWRYVDGEPRAIDSFLDSLRKYPNEVPGLSKAPEPDVSARDAMLAEMRERGGASRRITLHASVSSRHEMGEHQLVRAWLPFPVSCAQQSQIEVLDSTPGMMIAPESASQRTVSWQTRGVGSFEVSYAYVSWAPYVDTTTLSCDPAQPDFDTDERQPHIVFTPYLRELVASIVEGTNSPLERARAIYDWVTQNVDYRFQPPYMLLDCIPDAAAKSRRGDCGVFALTFITLCRIAGVPARWQSGLSVKPEGAGCHDWAMFYVAPQGWMWADCSFGSRARREGDEARRNHYFGNLDPWRMVANTQFFARFDPDDEALRDDPFDNQMGEMTVDGIGLLGDELVSDVELVSMEEV